MSGWLAPLGKLEINSVGCEPVASGGEPDSVLFE